MALNYGTLFDRIGAGLALFDLVNEFRGTTGSVLATDLPAKWEDFVAEYDGETDQLRATLGDPTAALRQSQDGLNGMQAWIANVLGSTILEMVDAESPLAARERASALAGLIELMRADNETVDANAVSVTPTPAAGNVGDGVLVASVRDGYGRTLEYCYDETIDVTFSQTTVAVYRGEAAAPGGPLNQQWPKGSAANRSLSIVSAGSGSDLLAGTGQFETFSPANTPSGWTIAVGDAGTDVLEETSDVFAGSKSLAIVGDGSTLVALTYDLSTAGLQAKTPYALAGWLLTDTTPAAGVLVIDLYDGASVIADEAGNNNSVTINLTTVDDIDFEAYSAVFRLPEPVPSTVLLRVRLTTALTNTRVLYLDHFALVAMTQLYNGGPFCALFGGATPFSLDDLFSLDVTNDYGGALQTRFWRVFGMPDLGLMLPSNAAGSETIADSVIA